MDYEYTSKARKALEFAYKYASRRKHAYVGTEHLLMGLLATEEGTASLILREYNLTAEKLENAIDRLIAPESDVTFAFLPELTPRGEKVLQIALEISEEMEHETIGTEELLLAILRETDCVAARLLHTLDVNIQKLYADILTTMGLDPQVIREEVDRQMSAVNQTDTGTPILDSYSRDLTEMAAGGELDPVIGREEEIGRMIRILSRRTKNNPCLIGEPGVGKTAIVEGLAQRIAACMVPEHMQNKRVVVLDLSGMVAGSKYRGEFEERIKNVIREVSEHRNILLFIDEIHTIIGAGGAEGALDASNILKPALSRGEIQVIGATTIAEYRKYIEKDAALERRFQPILVEEPSEEQSLEILKGLRKEYEAHHHVELTDEALEAAVRMSVRYMNDRQLPDKAIDLMDEAASGVRLAGFKIPDSIVEGEKRLKEIEAAKEEALLSDNLEEISLLQKEQEALQKKVTTQRKRFEKANAGRKPAVTAEEIAKTLSAWSGIPVQQITEAESKRLARLESTLHKRVISQNEAVKAVAKAIKRGRVGLKDPKRPVGSFLFLGPTGVGKTELSKALAEAVFGSEDNMIRVDMSEYMEKHSVSKMIGSPPGYVGYDEGGQLSEKVRRHPYSVILFDEIEKAHPDVFNILLQVLDDGHITDAQGRKVDFKQTVIIMTSNAGAQAIMEPKRLGFLSAEDARKDYEYMKDQVMQEVKRLFKPEFLNRIDETIVFHSLVKEDMKEIVNLLLKDLEKRCANSLEINLKVSPKAKEYLVNKGFDPKYGARPLKRTIQTMLEDALSEQILEGQFEKGDSILVGCKGDKLTFRKK